MGVGSSSDSAVSSVLTSEPLFPSLNSENNKRPWHTGMLRGPTETITEATGTASDMHSASSNTCFFLAPASQPCRNTLRNFYSSHPKELLFSQTPDLCPLILKLTLLLDEAEPWGPWSVGSKRMVSKMLTQLRYLHSDMVPLLACACCSHAECLTLICKASLF